MRRLVFAGLLSALTCLGQYQYDFTGAPDASAPDPAIWAANGTGRPGGDQAVQFYYTYGPGSYIYFPTVSGANANDYEVASTMDVANDGTFIHYLRASTDALATSTGGTGSYISVELYTGYAFNGPSTITVKQCVNGSVTTLASTTATGSLGMKFRTVVWGTNLWVFFNSQRVLAMTIPFTTGHPGFGGIPGQYGQLVMGPIQFGPHEVTPPAAPSVASVRSSILPNQISLQWQGVSDDPGTSPNRGTGVLLYQIWRGSTQLNSEILLE